MRVMQNLQRQREFLDDEITFRDIFVGLDNTCYRQSGKFLVFSPEFDRDYTYARFHE